MREALMSRTDDDYLPNPPRSRLAPAQGRSGQRPMMEGPSLQNRLWRFTGRYPKEIAVGLGLAGVAVLISWNALVSQTARHPSPWFGKNMDQAAIPASRPVAPSPAIPLAAPPAETPIAPERPATTSALSTRPTARDAIGDLIRTGDGPASQMSARTTQSPPIAPARPAGPTPVSVAPSAPKDPIAELIRLKDGPLIPPALVGKPDQVSSAQRALAKLGYLQGKADGALGPETRQALEKFERDRRLTVTGELHPRTARELSKASGIAVN